MDPVGPDGAPRDDGLDVRWGSDWRYIVSLYPDTKPYLWGLAAAIWDQGRRATPDTINPFWRDEPTRRTMLDKIQTYAKFLVAVVGAGLTSASVTFPDNTAVKDWGPLVLSLLTAVAVYAVPNKPPTYDAQHD